MKYATNIREIPNAFMQEPLKAEDMKEFYEETMEIRTGEKGDSPIEDIYDECINPESSKAFLLLGHRGCGKSTELNRLEKRLRDDEYPVKVIHCLNVLSQDAVYTDILMLMGDALLNLAKENNCGDPEDIDFIDKFWRTTISKEETIGDETAAALEAGAAIETPKFLRILRLLGKAKAELRYNDEKKTVYREEIRRHIDEWLRAMDSIAVSITTKTGKKPILIFEDLDKLTWDNWDNFSKNAAKLTGVKFPVIYTFPIAYAYAPSFTNLEAYFEVVRMPMIKLKNYDRTVCKAGITSIKEIIKKRADESLFAKGVISLLIEKTGGSLRNLFTVINKAAAISRRTGNDRISKAATLVALGEKKSAIIDRIEGDDYAFLADIMGGNREAIENKEKLLKMMQAGAVLEYKEGKDTWREVHPLVADFMKDHPELKEWNRENE